MKKYTEEISLASEMIRELAVSRLIWQCITILSLLANVGLLYLLFRG